MLPTAAWGKYDCSTGLFHLLEHHCADVAACFEALLSQPVLRRRFDAAAGKGLGETGVARLTYLAYLHDFGKVNAGFQFKLPRPMNPGPMGDPAPPRTGHIREACHGFARNEVLGALGLCELLNHWGDGTASLLCAMLAHHGRPAWEGHAGPDAFWQPYRGYEPLAAAERLQQMGRAWLPAAFAPGPELPDRPALAHLFAGVVALADQLGSDEAVFRPEPHVDPQYFDRASTLARQSIAAKGFMRSDWPVGAGPSDVTSLFGHASPRPAQEAVAAAPLDQPLLILESETGSGKTEAAVLRFEALWRAGIVDGLYFAVPTRAAARQLHGRVNAAMDRLLPSRASASTVLAVPGYLVAGHAEGRRAGRFDVFWEDQPDEAERRARWSAESARKYLTSATAVGTIDQVLLAGLRTKWAHFRAAALTRSLLVVDEVHASDGYMTELLLGVLGGHLDLGGHALLMSATLGSAASARFVRQSTPSADEAQSKSYPALTLMQPRRETETVVPISIGGSAKSVRLATLPILEAPGSIARTAANAARDGAKVLVIRNTVKSAQDVFEALKDSGDGHLALQAAGGPALHHSRFAVEDRQLLDSAVEEAIGKVSRTQAGVVVVGTQTLEQSLDIDADLLITDLCPVDVLLQRLGRLHRHARNDRAAAFAAPRCRVLVPGDGLERALAGDLLKHGLGRSSQGGIYENVVCLEATRRLAEDNPTWVIPDMNRRLVEQATHPQLLRDLAAALGPEWASHEREVHVAAAAAGSVARNHGLTRREEWDQSLQFCDLDQPVRTRLGEDGPRIKLPKPLPGPFGSDVRTFNLPAHLFGNPLPSQQEIEAARAEPDGLDGLILVIGKNRLGYSRVGLQGT